jgi:hypothetical protein
MNARLVIGIVGGAAAGFAAGWFLRFQDPPATGTGNVRIVQLETELKNKTREVERLTKAAAKPGGDNQTPDVPAYDPKSPEVVKRQEQIKKQMQEKQKLKLDERVAALRTRLGLNDEQAAAIRELLEKNPSGPQSFMAQAMAGEDVDESGMLLAMLRPGQKTAELTAKIAAVLTPEQQQAYAAVRQEQRTNDVEIKANKELARLQTSLTLTQEQKDKAFTLLSTLADQEYDNPVSPMAGPIAQQLERTPGAPGMKDLEPHAEEIKAAAALAAERRTQRIEAMREILTPEQMALYEDQQKQGNMAEFMDSAFEDMPGNFFMGAPVETEEPAAPATPTAPVEEKSK